MRKLPIEIPKPHRGHTIYTAITTLGIGIIAITMIFVLVQNRTLSNDIKQQTDINQAYLRCIILLPQEAFKDIPARVTALDKCSKESRNLQ